MYERVKVLYKNGKLTDAGLEKAVKLGWLTEEQKDELIEEGCDGD